MHRPLHPHNTSDPHQSQPQNEYLLSTPHDWRQHNEHCPDGILTTAWSNALQDPVAWITRCRRWTCPHCGRRRVAQLTAQAMAAEPRHFITLTVRPDLYDSPEQAYRATAPKIATLAQKLRREGIPFEYMRVLEATKRGWPHYHLAARTEFIPQRHLSELWAQLTGARIVDIRYIRKPDEAFRYVCKYLAKQRAVPWTDRRISFSKHFLPAKTTWTPPNLELHHVRSHPGDPAEELCQMFRAHYDLKLTSTLHGITTNPTRLRTKWAEIITNTPKTT